MFKKYDVIVVGAGHAGCEAALAAANLGSKVLLITMNMQTIAQMSCNPAMGGIAKGQILREIDALGGKSSIITDESLIQFRMLNKSKGPAMWSPRAQNDRVLFSIKWREKLELAENIDFFQDSVNKIIIQNTKCVGVSTDLGNKISSEIVILTNGTFLNGIIHIGETKFDGGRISEKKSTGITEQLVNNGFKTNRLKTGTPPRVDGRSLDYSIMEEQKGDDFITGFSFLPTKIIDATAQKSCFITYTNQKVHEKLKEGFDKSPMFTGKINGIGPRYCPSVEDKINRFSNKERHQIFVEPEGFNTVEIYVNGFSTSLPQQIQFEALKLIPGFEKVKMFRPGYAIEYDFFPPTQLKKNLETKNIENLFFAGQINGTTGYEEAACQGLMAGINAHQKINNLEPFILNRNEAYIGVLIDDLVTKGTNEPYRMFTSRAEFRTLLRQDNADLRLTEKSYLLGLASEERMHNLSKKINAVNNIKSHLNNYNISPQSINKLLEEKNSSLIFEKQKAQKLLLRPNISLPELIKCDNNLNERMKTYNKEELEQAEIQIKYERYIQKEEEMSLKINQLENLSIPESIDYEQIKSISSEAVQKFKKVKPKTLGQAGRISGVSPSDLQILMLYIKK